MLANAHWGCRLISKAVFLAAVGYPFARRRAAGPRVQVLALEIRIVPVPVSRRDAPWCTAQWPVEQGGGTDLSMAASEQGHACCVPDFMDTALGARRLGIIEVRVRPGIQ